MIEINLIPDVKQELLRAQRIRSSVITGAIIIGIASIGVVVVLSMYVFGFQTLRSRSDSDDITKNNEQLSSVKDLSKALTLQNQLTKISTLNANKKIDSRIFDVLKAVIIPVPAPNAVTISDLVVDASTNTVTINGQSIDSYAAVEVLKKTLDGAKVRFNTTDDTKSRDVPLASNISTTNTSYGDDASGNKVLRFTISFTYADELFSPASKNVKIVITKSGNVTDSYLGVPTSIFAPRAQDNMGGQ